MFMYLKTVYADILFIFTTATSLCSMCIKYFFLALGDVGMAWLDRYFYV